MINKFIKEIFNDTGLKSDGFTLKDKEILVAPINDFVMGYSFYKGNGNHLYVSLFILPTYWHIEHISLGYGWRLIGNHRYGEMFFSDESNLPFTKSKIIRLINESKHILSGIKTPVDFCRIIIEVKEFNNYKFLASLEHLRTMAVTQCYLKKSNCCEHIDEFLKQFNTLEADRMHLPWVQQIITNMQKLKEACYSKEKLEAIFKEWRNYTISKLRLEKYSVIY